MAANLLATCRESRLLDPAMKVGTMYVACRLFSLMRPLSTHEEERTATTSAAVDPSVR